MQIPVHTVATLAFPWLGSSVVRRLGIFAATTDSVVGALIGAAGIVAFENLGGIEAGTNALRRLVGRPLPEGSIWEVCFGQIVPA